METDLHRKMAEVPKDRDADAVHEAQEQVVILEEEVSHLDPARTT